MDFRVEGSSLFVDIELLDHQIIQPEHKDIVKEIFDIFKEFGTDSFIGMAASMGAFLLSSGAKGKRLALPNAEIMIHQPSAGTQGQITDMALHLKRLETIKKRVTQILADNCGRDLAQVTADCERDNFMTAQEALEYGLIDKIITNR